MNVNKQMWSHRTGWTDARHCLESNGLQPIKLGAKEGISMKFRKNIYIYITARTTQSVFICSHNMAHISVSLRKQRV